jgi:hypothetical protein
MGTIPRYLRKETSQKYASKTRKKKKKLTWKMQGSQNDCSSLTTMFAWILRPANLSFQVTIGKQETQNDLQLNCECCST